MWWDSSPIEKQVPLIGPPVRSRLAHILVNVISLDLEGSMVRPLSCSHVSTSPWYLVAYSVAATKVLETE
jgi:hypothetical protein